MNPDIPKKPEASDVRGKCACCGVRPQRQIASTRKGEARFGSLCARCERIYCGKEAHMAFRGRTARHAASSPKIPASSMSITSIATRATIVPESPDFCANCHRLKSKRDRDSGVILAGVRRRRKALPKPANDAG